MIFFKSSKRGIFFKNKQTQPNPSLIGVTLPRKGTKSTPSNTNLSRTILMICLSMMLNGRNNFARPQKPNSKNTTTSVKRLVTEDGTDVTSPKGIADHFNKFFVNVDVTLTSKFSTDTSKINPPVKTDARCVEDHIKNLKNGKATVELALEY